MAEFSDQSGDKAMQGVIDWWRVAGVDFTFSDSASGFLAEPVEAGDAPDEPEKSVEAAAAPAPPPTLGDPEGWPSELDAFRQWWMDEPLLDSGSIAGRIPPRGVQGAALMVLVGQPERADRESLLSGPDGQLLGAFLRAAGFGKENVYVASVLPSHDPAPDWEARHSAGFAAIAWRHVALASPQRLLVMGQNVRTLLKHDPTQRDFGLRGLNQNALEVPVLAGMGLAAMRKAPRTKAKLWRDWLDWTGK